MTEYKKSYYDLYQFLGGYFHQDWKQAMDWRGEQPTYEAVVRHFTATNSTELIAKTASQLQGFLALPLSNEEVENVLDNFHVAYNPRARGLTERQWLEMVLDVLKEPSARSHAMRVIG